MAGPGPGAWATVLRARGMDVSTTQSSPAQSAEYWRQRTRKVGHPGWKEPVTYAFDQRQRLRSIEHRLRELGLPTSTTALDFGCGTGDFSRSLLQLGMRVIAYDPYLTPSFQHPRLEHLGSHEALARVDSASIGLVVSVTVLDHVLDPFEFDATLRRLRQVTSTRGRLLALEYAPDMDQPSPAPHQAYRSLPVWRASLERAGWHLDAWWPMFHPVHAPAPGFARYQRQLLTRILARGSALRHLGLAAKWGLGVCARRAVDAASVEHPPASPLKLMLCTAVEQGQGP